MVLLCFYCGGTKEDVTAPKTRELPRFPTDNNTYLKGLLESFIQPTASGKILSGTYGCVRNNGRLFHAGIDIKSIHRDRKNLPTDKIFASLSGKVAYINANPSHSTYGRYIVLEHTEANLVFHTLYAHLAEISKDLKVGMFIKQSQVLGIMGYSSSLGLPKSRAHLHFEIGMRLGDNHCFEAWYASQKFPTRNQHGCWNGMNLVSLNPLDFLRAQTSFLTFIKRQPIAFQLWIRTTRIPQFIRLNAALLQKPIPPKLSGWKISFNWVGVPMLWEPLTEQLPRELSVRNINKTELFRLGNRHTLEFNKKGMPYLGKVLHRQLFELFGQSFRLL